MATQFASAAFTGIQDYVDVTWPTMAAGYALYEGVTVLNNATPYVWFTNVTSSGCRVNASARFIGSVDIVIEDVASRTSGPAGIPGVPLTSTLTGTFDWPQSFPKTLAQMQSFFPSASNVIAYALEETTGSLLEANGGASLAPTGSPKYGLGTPFSPTKHAIEVVDSASGFTASNTTAFDPAGSSYTFLTAFKLEQVQPNGFFILTKLSTGGFYIQVNTSGQVNVYLSDQGGHTIACTSSRIDYQLGAYYLLAVTLDTVAKRLYIRTDEEMGYTDISALTMSQITNSNNAIVLNYNAFPYGCPGSIAYLAGFAGTITDAQFKAWQQYGSTQNMGNLVFTPSVSAGVGLSTYDFRDPLNPRVRKHGHDQVPLDARNGKLGVAVIAANQNVLLAAEAIHTASWSTVGSGLTVTGFAAADPGFGYAATSLVKAASGTTPSRAQSFGAQAIQGYAMASVWLWTTDGGTHNATIQLVTTGDLAGTTTKLVQVTRTPQCFSILVGPITYASGIAGTFSIFPVDSTLSAATGGVFAWGAMFAQEQSTATIPLAYNTTNQTAGRFGTVTSTGGSFGSGNGYLELLFSAASDPPHDSPLITCAYGSGKGGVQLLSSISAGALQGNVFNSSGTSLFQASYFDQRIAHVKGKRSHCLMSWDFGLSQIRVSLDGMSPGLFFEVPHSGAVTWPAGGITPGFSLGYDTVNNFWSNIVIEKFSQGSAPSNIPYLQQASASISAMGSVRRIGCIGDSITGFFDGYHSKLATLLGKGRCMTASLGVSGNYTADNGGADCLSRVPTDIVGRGFDDVVVLVGVNDIMFGSATTAQMIDRLTRLYAAIAPNCSRIIACTINPCKGMEAVFGASWNVSTQAILIAVNSWIRANSQNNYKIVDLYTAFDDGTGAFVNYPTWTYDHLHPTHGVTGNAGVGADQQAAIVFAQGYGGNPL